MAACGHGADSRATTPALAVSCARDYVYAVNRWQRILVRVLVVAQLLSVAPFATAMPAAEHTDAMPCAEAMNMSSMPADKGDCPCCPDGADSLRDCLASCTLAAVALPDTPVLARAPVPALRVDAAPSTPLHFLSDPPLKPPPIR
jgi:hypothetical protein